MNHSIDLIGPTALEEIAPSAATTCSDTPMIIVRRGFAENDAVGAEPAIAQE